MKKEKQPSPVKAARKAIHERLLKELKNITAQLQKDGINPIVDIEKEAKKLAKKITKGAKTEQPAAPVVVKEKPAATDAKKPAKKSEPAKAKPAAEPALVKEKPVVAEAKTPAKKSGPAKAKPVAEPAASTPKAAVPAVAKQPAASKAKAVKAAAPKPEEKK